MATCKDCTHAEVCPDKDNVVRPCYFFKDRSKFIEQQTGKWIRHKPDAETMRAFHMAGIGKGMSENSIFWTCSACGGWGTPAYNYCSNCGAKMDKYRLGGGKELNV